MGYLSWKLFLYLIPAVYLLPRIYNGLVKLLQPLTSGLKDLPGPESKGYLMGNVAEILAGEGRSVQMGWTEKYGPIYRYSTMLGGYRLYSTDTRVLSYVVANAAEFPKPDDLRDTLGVVLGKGLLFVEGATHKRQRQVMNPSFGPSQIRNLSPIFFDKAQELRGILIDKMATLPENAIYQADMLAWLSRAALDVIGLAGFGYDFSSLSEGSESDSLASAFNTAFGGALAPNALEMMRTLFPILQFIPDWSERTRKVKESHATMRRIGTKIIEDKKAALVAGVGGGKEAVVEKNNVKDRDLLSLLIKANIASDVAESQRMSDEEVLAQISTFIMAGHETTSTTTSWALHELTCHPEIQAKLREELETLPAVGATHDEVGALPYLDGVVRETLRLHVAIECTTRVATKDHVVPTSEPFIDRKGVKRNEILIKKGDGVFFNMTHVNRLKSIWGEDALEFKPERWLSPPSKASTVPSVYSNIFTFFAGARGCIGHRFAVAEIKILLFTLVRDIIFEAAVKPGDIETKATLITRPQLRSEPENGSQLPMFLKLVNH